MKRGTKKKGVTLSLSKRQKINSTKTKFSDRRPKKIWNAPNFLNTTHNKRLLSDLSKTPVNTQDKEVAGLQECYATNAFQNERDELSELIPLSQEITFESMDRMAPPPPTAPASASKGKVDVRSELQCVYTTWKEKAKADPGAQDSDEDPDPLSRTQGQDSPGEMVGGKENGKVSESSSSDSNQDALSSSSPIEAMVTPPQEAVEDGKTPSAKTIKPAKGPGRVKKGNQKVKSGRKDNKKGKNAQSNLLTMWLKQGVVKNSSKSEEKKAKLECTTDESLSKEKNTTHEEDKENHPGFSAKEIHLGEDKFKESQKLNSLSSSSQLPFNKRGPKKRNSLMPGLSQPSTSLKRRLSTGSMAPFSSPVVAFGVRDLKGGSTRRSPPKMEQCSGNPDLDDFSKLYDKAIKLTQQQNGTDAQEPTVPDSPQPELTHQTKPLRDEHQSTSNSTDNSDRQEAVQSSGQARKVLTPIKSKPNSVQSPKLQSLLSEPGQSAILSQTLSPLRSPKRSQTYPPAASDSNEYGDLDEFTDADFAFLDALENQHQASANTVNSCESKAVTDIEDLGRKTGDLTVDKNKSGAYTTYNSLECFLSDTHTAEVPLSPFVKTQEMKDMAFTRYTVIEVEDEPSKMEKVLLAAKHPSSPRQQVVLRGSWYSCHVNPGDVVNVISLVTEVVCDTATQTDNGPLVIDNERRRYLIVHPDVLVSPSKVADACDCDRKAVLSGRLPNLSPQGEKALLGSIKHELFELAIAVPDFTSAFLTRATGKVIKKNLAQIYEVGVEIRKVREELSKQIAPMQQWAGLFFPTAPGGVSTSRKPLVQGNKTGIEAEVRIQDVVTTEEEIWCPILGLKGFIDATIRVSVHEHGRENGGCLMHNLVMPLELKTGQKKISVMIKYRAQVMLYSLMLRSRYGLENATASGLLLFVTERGFETEYVCQVKPEIRDLLMVRNRLATAIVNFDQAVKNNRLWEALPPTIQNERSCTYCFSKAECMTYHASIENGNEESSGAPLVFKDQVGHFFPSHTAFLRKWSYLIDLEALVIGGKDRAKIWSEEADKREMETGKCLADMSLVSTRNDDTGKEIYMFRRSHNPGPSKRKRKGLMEAKLCSGDGVIVSTSGYIGESHRDYLLAGQKHRVKVCRGRIRDINDHSMEILSYSKMWLPEKEIQGSNTDSIKFRIDLDEIAAGISTMRANLFRLFIGKDPEMQNSTSETTEGSTCNLPGDTNKRKLLVESESPRFETFKGLLSSSSTSSYKEYQGCVRRDLVKEWNSLNEDQKAAVQKVKTAKDYALVLGMPGTGKTSCICFVVRLLVAHGFRVLVTSYTHSAVDNLLIKLLEKEVPVLRIGGRENQVHPAVQPHVLDVQAVEDVVELDLKIRTARVVGATCLGAAGDPLLSRTYFDYCIVDEAGQISQPVVWGALRKASRFVLVGDHFQLPPLIRSRTALDKGMGVSLFKELAEAHPLSVQKLSYQYRMNAEIMSLCNDLIYKGELKCGNEHVAAAVLNTAGSNKDCRSEICWQSLVLDPNRKVLFFDTDQIRPGEILEQSVAVEEGKVKEGGSSALVNISEIDIIHRVIRILSDNGVVAKDMGIICPYRAQLKHLEQRLHPEFLDVEINTIDRYQGRDKACIIMSFVRSNLCGKVGELLKDMRRINVAISRAKHKMIMVGSSRTLKKGDSAILKTLMDVVEKKSWTHSLLPADVSI